MQYIQLRCVPSTCCLAGTILVLNEGWQSLFVPSFGLATGVGFCLLQKMALWPVLFHRCCFIAVVGFIWLGSSLIYLSILTFCANGAFHTFWLYHLCYKNLGRSTYLPTMIRTPLLIFKLMPRLIFENEANAWKSLFCSLHKCYLS